jgi:hypothetical protein
MDYSEPELVIPALRVINEGGRAGVDTSTLIRRLTQKLKPTRHDAEILDSRSDTHFSQKVRNLKCHDTLTSRGLATYSNGIWRITPHGKDFI